MLNTVVVSCGLTIIITEKKRFCIFNLDGSNKMASSGRTLCYIFKNKCRNGKHRQVEQRQADFLGH